MTEATTTQLTDDGYPIIEACRECGDRHVARWIEEKKDRLVRLQLCFHCDIWLRHAGRSHEHNSVRIDGSHYRYRADVPVGVAAFRGFGGREITIQFFDGRTVVTKNLWHQGTIPDRFRERLPDNARWGT